MAGPHDGAAGAPEPLSSLPEDRVLAMMARYLKSRQEQPVGSQLWAHAVLAYDECKRELDRRLIELILAAARERGEFPA